MNIKSLLTRIDFQIIGGLLIAIILPLLYKFGFELDSLFSTTALNTTIGSSISLIIGCLMTRRLSKFPGISLGAHIIAGYITIFVIVISIFFLMRLDYSRVLFIVNFGLCLAWFLLLHQIINKVVDTKLCILEGGTSRELLKIPAIKWSIVSNTNDYKSSMGPIVADLRHSHSDESVTFMANMVLEGIPVYHTKQVMESTTGKVSVEHLSENTFGSLIRNSIYLTIKSTIDWVIALIFLPFFLIITLIVSTLIKLSSPGPIFFKQTRIGYRGKEFTLYKFRTMKVKEKKEPKEKSHENLITNENDDRVISCGRFLRKSRIDELPQIINILKGEMSWVGPRPEAIELSDWYKKELPFYSYRHIVKPGITGWAQINQGHVTTPELVLEKLYFDFFYIKYFSFSLDFLVMVKTIKIIFLGIGAKL